MLIFIQTNVRINEREGLSFEIFTFSSLHIGKRVNEFSMIEDQRYILNQILDID